MHRCTALLLLIVALYFISAEAYKCRCTRKGPKIRYKDVQKLEIKPKHPYCQEKMIFIKAFIRESKHKEGPASEIELVFRPHPQLVYEHQYNQTSVTMENVSRFKGQEYCLHPKLQSTKNLVKWFRIWKDKHKVYEA